jgi:hypothetical protein
LLVSWQYLIGGRKAIDLAKNNFLEKVLPLVGVVTNKD